MTALSPTEVRAAASYPGRHWLGLAAAITALGCAASFACLFTALPPEPAPREFPAQTCDVTPIPSRCLDSLPARFRRIPTAEQYQAWRRVDLARHFEVLDAAASPPEEPVTQFRRAFGRRSKSRQEEADISIMSALIEIDPWTKHGYEVFRRAGTASPLAHSTDALFEMAESRDWSAPPPLLGPATELSNEDLRQAVPRVVPRVAAQLDLDRMAAYREAWAVQGAEESRVFERTWRRYRDAVRIRLGLPLVGTLCGLAAMVFALGWVLSAPIAIVATLHHLRVGDRRLAWTEVVAVAWRTKPIRIQTRDGAFGLGPHVLEPSAALALENASRIALGHARSLDPLDPVGLGRIRELTRVAADD